MWNKVEKRYGNGCSFHDGDITTVFLQNFPFFATSLVEIHNF